MKFKNCAAVLAAIVGASLLVTDASAIEYADGSATLVITDADPYFTPSVAIPVANPGAKVPDPWLGNQGYVTSRLFSALRVQFPDQGVDTWAFCLDRSLPPGSPVDLAEITAVDTGFSELQLARVTWLLAHSVATLSISETLAQAGLAPDVFDSIFDNPEGAVAAITQAAVHAALDEFPGDGLTGSAVDIAPGAVTNNTGLMEYFYVESDDRWLVQRRAEGAFGSGAVAAMYNWFTAHWDDASTTPRPALTIVPPAAMTQLIGTPVGPYTVRTTAPSVTLTTDFGVLQAADGTVIATAVDGTEFFVSSPQGGGAVVTASATGTTQAINYVADGVLVDTQRFAFLSNEPVPLVATALAQFAVILFTTDVTTTTTSVAAQSPITTAPFALPATGAPVASSLVVAATLGATGGLLIFATRRSRRTGARAM